MPHVRVAEACRVIHGLEPLHDMMRCRLGLVLPLGAVDGGFNWEFSWSHYASF